MAEVDLGRADMALVSDLGGVRVTIPRLQGYVPKRGYETTAVRFEGDDYPDRKSVV